MKHLLYTTTVLVASVLSYSFGHMDGFTTGRKAVILNLQREFKEEMVRGKNFCIEELKYTFIPLKEGKVKVRKHDRN